MSETAQILEALDKLNARLDGLEAKVDAIGGGAVATNGVAAKLADPKVSGSIERILDRADTLEATVKFLDNVAANGPWLIDTAAQMANMAATEAAASGIDPITLTERSLVIAQKAMKPESLDLVEAALDNPKLAMFGLKTGAKVLAKLEANGTDLDALGDEAAEMSGHGAFALAETRKQPIESPGLFGLMMAPMDADVARFLGFGLAFARKMGKRLA